MNEWTEAYLNIRNITLLILAVGFAAARIGGVKNKSYQAFAHLFTGGLAGAWLVGRAPVDAVLFVALCVVEVACFLIGLLHPTPSTDEGKEPLHVHR